MQKFASAGLAAAILLWTGQTGLGAEPQYRRLEIGGYQLGWPKKPGETLSLSWSFAQGLMDSPDAINCKRMTDLRSIVARLPPGYPSEAAREAFANWQAQGGIRFTYIADWRNADILIGAQAEPKGVAYANVAFQPVPGMRTGKINKALICLNPDARWKSSFDGNLKTYELTYVLTHEIGHALGLDHPSRTGQVMSFKYEERFNKLQPGDIAGFRSVYGAKSLVRLKQAVDWQRSE
ncbi:MAG: matrixin family metalloprotease [Beijerinckiaceae bacterium]